MQRSICPFVFRVLACCLAMAGVFAPSLAQAQLPQTKLFAISPMGGQAGQSFDLSLSSGTDLEEIGKLVFTHPGITAAPKMQDVNGKPQPVANVFTVAIAPDVPPGRYEVRAVGFYGISNPRAFQVARVRKSPRPNPTTRPRKLSRWNSTRPSTAR